MLHAPGEPTEFYPRSLEGARTVHEMDEGRTNNIRKTKQEQGGDAEGGGMAWIAGLITITAVITIVRHCVDSEVQDGESRANYKTEPSVQRPSSVSKKETQKDKKY